MKHALFAALLSFFAATLGLAQVSSRSGGQPGERRHIGVNLEGLTYYSRGLVFADAMLQAQNFYAGADAGGNPTADQTTIIFSNCTPAFAGTYKFACKGQPTLKAAVSYATVASQSYNATTNTTTADITLTAQQIQAIPQLGLNIGNVVAGKVSNVQVWRPGANAGVDRFYGPFVKIMAPFDTIRFMDFLSTNGSTQVNWSDRPQPTDRNFTIKGGCYEDALLLCKQTNKAPWLCMPCQANADYLNKFIMLVKQRARGPVYIEWSNEIWNSAFPQWKQAMELAAADKSLAYDGTGDPNILLYRWMGKQAVNISKAAQAAYGVNDIRKCPIRPILAGQWGNPDVLKYALDYINTQVGPANQYIYGIAIAPYATLSGNLWGRIQNGDATVTKEQIVADYQSSGINNSSMTNSGTAAFVSQAKQYNLHTRAYEFGFDSGQAQQAVTQKAAAAHEPAMGPILTTYINNWWAAGCEGLNWFTLTAADTSNGQWGLTADTYDMNTPKYQAAVAAARAAH
ncbi:MAG TPA: hypothetical protein VG269_12475 [Tepidisphaeraceae bacterium]|jgi:hypothetical protein|nr:hypothetical protein [Tepidisphaeraceae bacterium]